MKNRLLSYLTVALATVSFFLSGCDDDVSGIGNSISSSEVTINMDSLVYPIKASTVDAPSFESKSAYNLLGSIDVPEYGKLDCSYVTQFLPALTLGVPDSISSDDVDSVKMIFSVPKTYVTGDTLAPQQLKIYSLIKPIPDDITSEFNPEGYYNKSPLSVKSYTLSGYSFNDTTFVASNVVQVKADLPVEIGRDAFNAYRDDPEMFVWPEKFAEYWPGIFVEPSFGKGCIAPVQSTGVYAYFPKTVTVASKDDEGNSIVENKQVADSVCLFITAPEVLSNVNISYQPSDKLKEMIDGGKCIITTPGGYTTSFEFPAVDILKEYWKEEYDLGVINNMVFSIPAKIIKNTYGLGLPPALLMIKTSEMDNFFAEGRLPDNKSSFTSLFSAENNTYTFNSMREYIVELRNKGEENITPEDVEFTLIPVTVSTEDYTDTSTGNLVTAVTTITPYIIMPTMAELDMENAVIVFTFSNQTIY